MQELESELEAEQSSPPPGTHDLHQGDETFEIELSFSARDESDPFGLAHQTRYKATINPSWNEIFAAVAPKLINEAADLQLRAAFRDFFRRRAIADFEDEEDLAGKELRDFKFSDEQIDTCIVQLRALGLIEESQKKRSVNDKATYWTLSKFGDHQMVLLRAVSHAPKPERKVGSKSEASDDAE